jgi:hypothetical protein
MCCGGCPSNMHVTSFQWYKDFAIGLILKACGIQIQHSLVLLFLPEDVSS